MCPASLLGNWEAETARFAPTVSVRRFHGGQRSLEDLTDGFVLTTYGTLRRDHARLAEVAWDLVVADEAQHVKNARSSTARALRGVPSRARVALTGTPVENDLTELWSILDWATPGLLGSRNAFRKVWAAPIESGLEPTKARQFAALVGPFLLRRRKSDPGIAPELPAKTETDHPLGLTREQVVLYEAFVRDTMERIERAGPEDTATRRGLVLALLTGLKQICNHPAHFLKQSGAVRLAGRSEKLDLLDELLGTVLAEDGAALVFTQYVAMATAPRDPPRPRRRPPPGAARRDARHRAGRDGAALPGRGGAGVPALPQGRGHRAQPHAPPTTSSTSTGGGTPRSRSRPPTVPTGSVRPSRSRSTGSSPAARSRRRWPSCWHASAPWPTRSSAGARPD